TDTATIMQNRSALELVETDMEKIAAALADLAQRYRDTPMAGRSNLQQAVPITFGFKAATLLAAMQRHRERLAQLRPRVLVGEFAGAAGTLSSLGQDGLKVQAALMEELGLGQPEIAWHTVRDRIGEVGCFLGLLTGTLGKLSMDVKLLMQTEVAEVFEPFHAARMRANLDLTGGLVVTEAVMMGLAPHLGRQRAHDLIYDISRQVVTTGKPLIDLLAADADIARHLTREELEKLVDPANYLGLAGEMIDRVLAAEQRA